MEATLNYVKDFFTSINYGVIVQALLTFAIGIIISKIFIKALGTGLEKSRLDKTAHGFIKSLLTIILYLFTIVIALSVLGVPMTSIVAVIGAASLAVGLALQSSLSNLAGGFIILFAKPFKVGDFIETNGTSGVVNNITILSTEILTPDNKVTYIPNGTVSGGTIINYTQAGLRRLDLEFSVAYGANYGKAKQLIVDIIESNPMASKENPYTVTIGRHDASAVIIFARTWVSADKYWDLNFEMMEKVLESFQKNDIEIPFNQLDVHIKDNSNCANLSLSK